MDDYMSEKLSHIDEHGRSRMVDVSDKEVTARRAVAECRVCVTNELQNAIENNALKKGDLLETARLAGINAAKRTDELIPLCHALPLEHVDVQLSVSNGSIFIRSEIRATAKTGVEMEAYTACAVAALTVIDMGKAIDPSMVIENLRLIEKIGGRRGEIKLHESEFPR